MQGFIGSCALARCLVGRQELKRSPNGRCHCYTKRVVVRMTNSLQAARQEVVKTLARDLVRQYEEPLAMDFSVYDDDVTFDDPTTKLKGKLAYKDDTRFELMSCELTKDESKVRTTFSTKGTTKWGSFVEISGEDFFWFKDKGSSQLIRHQSTWDQSAEEVFKAIRGV